MPKKNYSLSRRGLQITAGVLAAILVILLGLTVWITGQGSDPSAGTNPPIPGTSTSTPGTDPTTLPTDPTDPPVVKLSTATISNTGDMLMHMPFVNSCKVDSDYDFTNSFRYFKEYVSRADYAVANLETTLYGPDFVNDKGNVGYSGYPNFNSPDVLIRDLQDTGFDMLLTANNHSYDSRNKGFHRTQQVLQEYGMNYLGTVASQEQSLWQVRDINGIKVGMVCYTYQTGDLNTVKLNGIPMNAADKNLIGTFAYEHLDVFYEQMDAAVTAMEAAGAEAVVLYIHWGDEYAIRENASQNAIAQKMCDLGVDVIVGGHSHVVQPMELLTSTEDPQQKTVCLYSMGNTISNQRREEMSHANAKAGYTEDGVLFSFTFAKYSDGTVILESADILPLWVNHYYNSTTAKYVYEVLPLDRAVEDWRTQYQLSDAGVADVEASYKRTMNIVGTGLAQIQTYLQDLVRQTEEALGVK